MSILEEKITAIEKVHHEFAEIMKLERCRTCSCLHKDILAAILENIRDTSTKIKDDGRLAAFGKDFAKWIEDANSVDLHQ